MGVETRVVAQAGLEGVEAGPSRTERDCESGTHLCVHLLELGSHLLRRKVLLDKPGAFLRATPLQYVVTERLGEGLAHRSGVPLYNVAELLRLNEGRQLHLRGDDDGQSCGHGLQYGYAEVFLMRGQHEHVRRREQLLLLSPLHEPYEGNVVLKTERSSLLLPVLDVGVPPRPGDDEVRVGHFFKDALPGAQ